MYCGIISGGIILDFIGFFIYEYVLIKNYELQYLLVNYKGIFMKFFFYKNKINIFIFFEKNNIKINKISFSEF